jgi:alpha-ketoglutarate-dependent taurine dioxygenase
VLSAVLFDPAKPKGAAAAVLEAWNSALIVHLQAAGPIRDVRATYDALLPFIGTPRPLAEDVRAGGREAQRTGQLWSEVRFDPAFPDAYRHSKNAQPLHIDGSYVASLPNAALMCCVQNAARGGETVFISGDDLVAALRDERPDLLEALTSTPMPHERSGDRRVRPVIRRQGDQWLLNWNYYCVSKECGPRVLELREAFFAYLRDSKRVREALLEVKLKPGDCVVWKDERVLHGRNAFLAQEIAERFLWKCALDVGVFP